MSPAGSLRRRAPGDEAASPAHGVPAPREAASDDRRPRMEIVRTDLTRCADLEGTVVVIDVLRSFSTAAYALAAGATQIVAVASPESLPLMRRRYPGSLAVGALPGGASAPGFDIGNSPAALAAHDLSGRTVIQHTAGGMRSLIASKKATTVLAASLVCARATARYVLALAPSRVTLVITGLWVDRDGDEDYACADRIEAFLRGESPPPEPYARRVRESSFGRRFQSGTDLSLPRADLDLSAVVDCFDFAMPVERDGDEVRLIRVPARDE